MLGTDDVSAAWFLHAVVQGVELDIRAAELAESVG